MIDGLLAFGCDVTLLGAPGSPSRPGLVVPEIADHAGVENWLLTNSVDIIHDHTNGDLMPTACTTPSIGTFHVTDTPKRKENCVYVSYAQRANAGTMVAPVIPLPVNSGRYRFRDRKQDYLLFLGRVSRHKGVAEAAAFATAAGLPLVVAGPSWEPEYRAEVSRRYPRTIEYVGDVGGDRRLELLASARAVLVMSQPVSGPHGDRWSEPGATVVSEAAASGTPTVATANGCLPEIVPGVGIVLPDVVTGETINPEVARRVLEALPRPREVRTVCCPTLKLRLSAALMLRPCGGGKALPG
jgi:glycosyltransferase involved in cell wall biosynthesis